MTMKLSFLNQKGGVGKTTLSVNVADAFARLGKRTLLVDADPQASAMEWAAQRDAMHEEGHGPVLFPVISLAVGHLHKELPPLAQDYDVVVIDGPPRVNDIATAVIVASDLVMMPVTPSSLDVWATDDIIELIGKARVMKEAAGEAFLSSFVVNRKKAKTVLGNTVSAAMKEHQLPLMPTEVSDRIDFAKAVTRGRTVLETVPKGPAAQEINQLVNDIMELFDDQGRLIQPDAA